MGGIIIAVLVLLTLLLPEKQAPESDAVPVTGSDYPLPPLDLAVPTTTPRQKALKAKQRSARKSVENGQSEAEKADEAERAEPASVTSGKENSDGDV